MPSEQPRMPRETWQTMKEGRYANTHMPVVMGEVAEYSERIRVTHPEINLFYVLSVIWSVLVTCLRLLIGASFIIVCFGVAFLAGWTASGG